MTDLPAIDRAIQAATPGRSFIDIGGLFGEVNEKASVAALGGAARVAMADALPFGHPLWDRLAARMDARSLPPAECACGDIEDSAFMAGLGTFDVVHTNGVLYHLANPMLALLNLRRMTGARLFLGSMTMPEVIENQFGRITLGGGTMMSIPAMSPQDRRILGAYFEERGLFVHNINTAESYSWVRPLGDFNTEPWWWLWTIDTLARLAEIVGFKVVGVIEVWLGYSHVVECEVA